MSVSCGEVRERFDRYAQEALDSAERRELREHLRACGPCAEEASAADPSLLFAALPLEDVSADEISRVVSAVRMGVELRRAEKRLARSPRRVAAIGAVAAVLALTLFLPGRIDPPTERTAAADPGSGPATAPVPQFLPGAAPAGATERFPAAATIYDWNPGSSRDEPRVVWIVDRSLDL
jgi:putative zinc finger protein